MRVPICLHLRSFFSSSPDHSEGDPQVRVSRWHRDAGGDCGRFPPGDSPDRGGGRRVQSDQKNCAPQRRRSEGGETVSTLFSHCAASLCFKICAETVRQRSKGSLRHVADQLTGHMIFPPAV